MNYNSGNTQEIVKENQKMIVEMIKSFGEKEIKPNIMIWDEAQIFPVDLFRVNGCTSTPKIWR